MEVHTQVAGRHVALDARDVARWAGLEPGIDAADARWDERAAAYVAANPRPGGGAQAVAGAQRTEVMRRLAAGPAARDELRAALRRAGWVGASDLDNRLRELRAADGRSRASRTPLAISESDGVVRLTAAWPTLDEDQRQALAFARSIVGRVDAALAGRAVAAIDALVPDLPPAPEGSTLPVGAPLAASAALDAALAGCHPVEISYHAASRGYPTSLRVVPREYVTVGRTVKAICVPVTEEGSRGSDVDRQLVVNRILEVRPLDGWARPDPDDVVPTTEHLRLTCTASLWQVLAERGLLGISEPLDSPDHDVVTVEGTFPTALAWDVMEQLCAWSGQVQVLEPLWLLRAVTRKLRIGLAVQEAAGPFVLVAPREGEDPTTLADALAPAPGDTDGDAPSPNRPARRLGPREG